jgi:hypothetical protein
MYHPQIIEQNRLSLERGLRAKGVEIALKEHSHAEVQEFLHRLRGVEWDEEGVPSQEISDEDKAFISNEILMSRISFPYWLERYCFVLTDRKTLEPLIPWPSQRRILDAVAEEEIAAYQDPTARKVKIALLKARQIGGTALSEAIVGHMTMLQPMSQGIIASDHPDNTNKLWQTLLRMHENMPGWMRPARDSKIKAQHLHFSRLDSDVVAGSGNQKTTLGQGMNVDVAHLSEVSTWQQSHFIDLDLMPAFDSSRKHHSIIILESTGCGGKGNWFHDRFQSARKGSSSFRAVFIAWYLRPGWRMRSEGVTFDDTTKAMAQRVEREEGVSLDRDQLAWWQQKRVEMESEDKLEDFYQEYAGTPEEAFQMGVRSVFPLEIRAKVRDGCREPVGVFEFNLQTKKLRPVPLEGWIKSDDPQKWENRLVVWEWAREGYVYVIGGDASHGIPGKDLAALQVLRVGNRVLEDEQVAEWAGTISPMDLATPVEILGQIYADKTDGFWAKVAMESNPGSPGATTQMELMRRGYPHFYIWQRPFRADGGYTKEYGWWTTPTTRNWLTDMGLEYILNGHLRINSQALVAEEMAFFVDMGVSRQFRTGIYRRHLEHAPGYHDDRLFALFIALFVAHGNEMKNVAEDRRQYWIQKTRPQEERREFNTLGVSWKQALEEWEDGLA